MKKITVLITIEGGCDFQSGEYDVELLSFTEPLILTAPGGTDDISLVLDAIPENITVAESDKTEIFKATFVESGEWEDVFWHKWYDLESVEDVEDEDTTQET